VPPDSMSLALRYLFFAILATALNIAGQDITIRLYDGNYAVQLSILTGTGIGLITKYILDKRYIFYAVTDNLIQDARVFFLYTAMGVVTTGIFWGTEWAFHIIYDTKAMRYTGAVIGLAIGYIIKYLLDKRFVFNNLDDRRAMNL
jgi:putative flippase GtrA